MKVFCIVKDRADKYIGLVGAGQLGAESPAVAGRLLPAVGEGQEEGQLCRDRPRAVLAEFLRKLLRLSVLRLADLCERLDLAPMDQGDVLRQVCLLCLCAVDMFSRIVGGMEGREDFNTSQERTWAGCSCLIKTSSDKTFWPSVTSMCVHAGIHDGSPCNLQLSGASGQ